MTDSVHSKILITGAGGFAGWHLAQGLDCLGHEVVRVSRHYKAGQKRSLNELCLSSQSSEQEWSTALTGCSAVIHCAGTAHVLGPQSRELETFYEGNVAFTEKLARASANVGVKRFIHLSSISVYDDSTFAILTEHTDLMPSTQYGYSKLLAEETLQRILNPEKIQCLRLRLPLLYGANPKGNMLRLLKLVASGVPMPLANIANSRSMLSVNNLIGFLDHALRTNFEVSGAFNLTDAESLSTPQIISSMAKGLIMSPRLFAFPQGVLRKSLALMGKKDAYDKLCGSLLVDSSLVRQRFAWQPDLRASKEIEIMASSFKQSNSK
ncbi:NAD-dependent epimerase/dehydratase family protein [Gilvimarinus chinensis]|uniref:NAD-dependent epimerase/dehydratase family protein n=1 Tax=Gilvimarinus chinensis TaxID=396005 RepID=UPI000374117E|nr:NAD-dependent epimerase/dehydratase family protein [Gilvimarinus chinensis]